MQRLSFVSWYTILPNYENSSLVTSENMIYKVMLKGQNLKRELSIKEEKP